jgi:hypothetical protein
MSINPKENMHFWGGMHGQVVGSFGVHSRVVPNARMSKGMILTVERTREKSDRIHKHVNRYLYLGFRRHASIVLWRMKT